MAKDSQPLDLAAKKNNVSVQYKNQDQKNGYRIGTYEYPEDLRNRPDLQHYVAFYINVRDKTTRGKNKNPKEYFSGDEEAGRIQKMRDDGAPVSIKNLESGLADVLTVAKTGAGVLASYNVFKGLNSR